MEERLQKLLSAAGVLSRRHAEDAIQAGRVTVNGAQAVLGQRADPERDEIRLDGVPVLQSEERRYLMLNKPRGYVTTLSDERGRKTAAQLVADCGVRVYPVGRLDMDSEGLLLFTNDGALANQLLHPRNEVEKEYHVRVQGDWRTALSVLRGRIVLDGQLLSPAAIRVMQGGADTALLSVTIHEGKNRQIRRMCALAGLRVFRLKRVREGGLHLGDLPPGKWRALTPDEIEALRTADVLKQMPPQPCKTDGTNR